MADTIIKNARIVNEGKIFDGEVLIRDSRIEKIAGSIEGKGNENIIDAEEEYLLPGLIDSHVHFREPGLTHKADIRTESRAAVSAGITSFMEMPNTLPPAITIDKLNDKFEIASQKSFANYSFYLGASNDNLEELKKADPKRIGAIKVFMGSSTGNMLVDDEQSLKGIFGECEQLIAIHAEEEPIIARNKERVLKKYEGKDIPVIAHAEIRDKTGCIESTKKAMRLARESGTRLHVLHLTTADEVPLFDNKTNPADKKISCEVCPHHLYFSAEDYNHYGTLIKCNPAIKGKEHKEGLLKGLKEGYVDMVVSDHAPHTLAEKEASAMEAPAGIPMVQHTFNLMLEYVEKGIFQLQDIVNYMAHRPAELYKIQDRGFLKEGYFADITLLDWQNGYTVSKGNIRSKAGWSPFEGKKFKHQIDKTWVNGKLVYNGEILERPDVMELRFNYD